MQKLLNKDICFMSIMITILEMALIFSTPYSKSILPIYPLNELVWSFIIFVVFFFVFSAFAILRFTTLTFSQHKKQMASSFIALLLIRVIFDLSGYIFQSIEARVLYSLITDCIFFIIMFQIIIFAYTGKKLIKDLFSIIKAKDKPMAIAVLLYCLLVAVSISYLSYKFIGLLRYTEKYTLDSSFYLFQSMNYIFNSQLLRMFIAIILQTLLVIILNKLYEEKTDRNLYWSKKLIKVIARSDIIPLE